MNAEAEILFGRAKSWITDNKLQLNEDKTQKLLCTLQMQASEPAVKLLGYRIDPKLT
jgi:hypothetical protein